MAPVPEYAGDIFKTPEGSVLIHACNCLGEWGSGIALAMQKKFPAAYEVYRKHCQEPDSPEHQAGLRGTALLIPPQEKDIKSSGRYWIACLFTSVYFGARKDKPDAIVKNTRTALAELKKQIDEAQKKDSSLKLHDHIYAVRINALAFGVPWDDTRKVLEESGLKVSIVNNLAVMRQPEKDQVIKSMKENGFDTEASPPWEKQG